EALERLVEGEARVTGARPREHEDEAGEAAHRRAHADRPEVAPVDLALLAGHGLEPQIGLGPRGGAHRAHVALDLEDRARIAALAHHGPQAGRAQARILLQRRAD